MITKDISKNNSICENKFDVPEVETNSPIDEIFAEADKVMQAKEQKSVIKNKQKKKKHRILKSLLIFVLILILLAGIAVGIVSYAMKTIFPEVKSTFIAQWAAHQEELKSIDDSTLTVEEYYQKQIFLLITPEELDGIIDSISDIRNLECLLDKEMDYDLIPPDKVDEYNRLMEEYEQAMEDIESGKEVTTPVATEHDAAEEGTTSIETTAPT